MRSVGQRVKMMMSARVEDTGQSVSVANQFTQLYGVVESVPESVIF